MHDVEYVLRKPHKKRKGKMQRQKNISGYNTVPPVSFVLSNLHRNITNLDRKGLHSIVISISDQNESQTLVNK